MSSNDENDFEINENYKIHEDPLLNIKIKINEKESAQLIIYSEEDINTKISEFCEDHNLSKEQQDIILEEIMNKLDSQIEDRKH